MEATSAAPSYQHELDAPHEANPGPCDFHKNSRSFNADCGIHQDGDIAYEMGEDDENHEKYRCVDALEFAKATRDREPKSSVPKNSIDAPHDQEWKGDGRGIIVDLKPGKETVLTVNAVSQHLLRVDHNTANEAARKVVRTVMERYTKAREWMRAHPGRAAILVGGITLIVVGGPLATLAISSIGFGSGGVIAGSIAAGIQSAIGNIVAGSAFATFQSLAATGMIGVIGGGVSAVVGSGLLLVLPEVRASIMQGIRNIGAAFKDPQETWEKTKGAASSAADATARAGKLVGVGCMIATAYGMAKFKAWGSKVKET